MVLTQAQYLALKNPIRRLNIKIELINEYGFIVDAFEGISTGGNITLDANSNYRRTGSLEMIINTSKGMLPAPDSKIWMNKRIGVHIGLKDFTEEILWFNMGRFAIASVSLDLGLTEHKMSCELLDMMAFLDGTLGGQLSHETRIVSQGVTINEAIIKTLGTLGNVSLDNIMSEGSLAVVPMDIEMPPGSTVYDLIRKLTDLYRNYSFYFDEDGYFRLSLIKNKKEDPIIWDFTDINLSINYKRDIDFKNIKNSIWVWGRQLEDGTQIVWNYRNRFARESQTELNLIVSKEKNDICHIRDEDISYLWNGTLWIALDFTVVPDFRMESVGEKIMTVSQDTVFTEEQAKLRAEFELTNYSNWAEALSFNTVPIYALKPEQKIKIEVNEIGINGEFLVQNINIPLDIGGTSSITAEKIY